VAYVGLTRDMIRHHPRGSDGLADPLDGQANRPTPSHPSGRRPRLRRAKTPCSCEPKDILGVGCGGRDDDSKQRVKLRSVEQRMLWFLNYCVYFFWFVGLGFASYFLKLVDPN